MFTIVLLLAGVFTLFYAAGAIIQAVVSGEIRGHLGRQRVERKLAEKPFIVARAEDEEAEQKRMRAGASRVVSPYVIGGQRVAQAVLASVRGSRSGLRPSPPLSAGRRTPRT